MVCTEFALRCLVIDNILLLTVALNKSSGLLRRLVANKKKISCFFRQYSGPTLLQCLPIPMRKLSGLMSLWMKFLLCTYSILPIIWKGCVCVYVYVSVCVRVRNSVESTQLYKQKHEGYNNQAIYTLVSTN